MFDSPILADGSFSDYVAFFFIWLLSVVLSFLLLFPCLRTQVVAAVGGYMIINLSAGSENDTSPPSSVLPGFPVPPRPFPPPKSPLQTGRKGDAPTSRRKITTSFPLPEKYAWEGKPEPRSLTVARTVSREEAEEALAWADRRRAQRSNLRKATSDEAPKPKKLVRFADEIAETTAHPTSLEGLSAALRDGDCSLFPGPVQFTPYPELICTQDAAPVRYDTFMDGHFVETIRPAPVPRPLNLSQHPLFWQCDNVPTAPYSTMNYASAFGDPIASLRKQMARNERLYAREMAREEAMRKQREKAMYYESLSR